MRSVAFALPVVFLAVTSMAAVPRLVMPGDDGTDAVVLSKAAIRVTIRGHLARTEYELTFRNALPRVVGGEFIFPLPPDGEVSDLGLYFDGKLRHAVAVERVKAKQAYEETVHRRVDPALAEWSDSRAFRMRLYPIPANGEKRVFIACDQELVANEYFLDLRFKQKLEAFSLTIDSDVQPVVTQGLPSLTLTNAVVDGTVTVPRDTSDVALTAWSERERAWLVSAPLHVAGAERAFDPAAHVTLLWDASGSAAQQDGGRLRAFLYQFLRQQTAWATVTVIPFHLWVDDPRRTVPHDLERVLDAIDLAGATNLTAMLQRLPSIAAHVPGSRIVLVTDGINSMGDTEHLNAAVNALASMHRPLTVVNAAPHANEPLLRLLAETTGGRYLDLTTTASSEAAARAMLRPAHIELPPSFSPRVVTSAGAARVAVASSAATQPFSVRVAGRELTVREVGVPGLVERAWARARLRELTKPEEIAELGKRHTMMTPQTSLIVLENWRDYAMYGIDAPPDLPPTPSQVAKKAVWFVKGSVLDRSGTALPGATVTLFADGDVAAIDVTDENGHFWLGAPRAPARFSLRAELAGFGRTDRAFATAPSGGDVELHLSPAVSESITVTAESPMLDGNSVDEALVVIGQHHEPGDKQRLLRAAEALRADDATLALRKLTNLAEAYADDAPVVRIVARIADGWGRADVARDLLLHALEISPREPQTWRELMLLAQRSGRGGDAQALRTRFNAVARSARLRLPPDALDVDAHAGADLQVDVMWECDYCDVDLHVIEPDGEEVMYSHRSSKHGGTLSDDITGGFGPEIYSIAKAPRGTYRISVQYYSEDRTEVSAATLVHVIVTARGRRQDHTLLLSNAKELNEVATVQMGGGH